MDIQKLRLNPIWYWIIIVVVPALIYFKTVSFGFVDVDDKDILINNADFLLHLKNIPEAFFRDCFMQPKGILYRPIQTVSFILDAQIGKNNPWMYHLSNLLIHIITSLSVFYFLQFLKFKKLTAFLFALLFSIHPLLTSNVSWISTRGDELLCPIGIWLFVFFGKFVKSGNWVQFGMHTIFFMLALFTKETSILFPLLLLFYYWFILSKEKKITTGQFILLFVAWISVPIIYYFVRASINPGTPINNFGIMPFLKNLPAFPIIIGKFFIPFNLSTLPLFDTPSLIIGIGFSLLLLYLTIKYIKEKQWLFILGGLWFFLFVIPPMFLRIDNANHFIEYYEHRTYLPVLGIIISMAFLLDRYLLKIPTKILLIVSVSIISLCGYLAWKHSNDYKDAISFYTAAIRSNPNNSAAYLDRAGIYYSMGNFHKAIDDCNKSIYIQQSQYSYYDKGCAEINTNNYVAADTSFTKSIQLDSNYLEAYIDLAIVKNKLNKFDEALSLLNNANRINPNNALVLYHIGFTFFKLQEYDSSIASLSKSIELDPTSALAFNCRAWAEYNTKEHTNACKDWTEAVRLGNTDAKVSLDKYCNADSSSIK